MLDRVREALFSTLMPWLEDAQVLDLFAGSGSLGIEALSRGARHVRFVESGAPALACLKENVEALGLADACELVRADGLTPGAWGEPPSDVVFVDPPYRFLDEPNARGRVLEAIATLAARYLAPEGVLVFHTPPHAVTSAEFGPDVRVRERTYGTNALWYVQRDEEVPA
jgi:16S rRNA (guanine966-N2)-methyltransferase